MRSDLGQPVPLPPEALRAPLHQRAGTPYPIYVKTAVIFLGVRIPISRFWGLGMSYFNTVSFFGCCFRVRCLWRGTPVPRCRPTFVICHPQTTAAALGTDPQLSDVHLGMRVRRGRCWFTRRNAWRGDKGPFTGNPSER